MDNFITDCFINNRSESDPEKTDLCSGFSVIFRHFLFYLQKRESNWIQKNSVLKNTRRL